MGVLRTSWTFIISLLFGLVVLLHLSLQVVFCQVTVLTHTVGVVRLVGVAASMSHLGFALAVVAIVAHIFGVVFLVSVWTLVDLSSFPLAWNFNGLVIFFA